ncbi:putative dna repair and recombination protein rhm52 protein [Colletotrichum sp. SAR 10_75]|nr:putative dna repair and recombination protein rhm52 protein [Colletotrichum sp. SAR 10_75]
MPAPGDQHSTWENPFEEPQKRMSEYTAQEIATLQSRLEKQLGPEYISARAGPSGQKVHYIAAEKCIALANEVFGFNGWSSSIQNIQVDFVDEHPQTMKISLGLSVIMRVTLRDGTYHEDIGYGHIENCKGKAAAFEKAKKEGTTDALKRALRNFGNVLGNCIYDKDYLSKVTKMKVAPTKFNEGELHRHSDFAAKKEEKAALPPPPPVVKQETTADSLEDLLEGGGGGANPAEPIAFFSARAVQQIPDSALQGTNTDTPLMMPAGQQAFNPKAESPSIRKTPGIDHNSSKPLSRNGTHVPPTSTQAETPAKGSGFTPVRPAGAGPAPNPQFSQARRIGAPGGAGSPLANRGSYRPPTMKRPLQQDGGAGRPALADVSNNGGVSTVSGGGPGLDPKRQKMS